MSFLTSILSSIGHPDLRNPLAVPAPPILMKHGRNITTSSGAIQTGGSTLLKRGVESDQAGPPAKVARTNGTASSSLSTSTPQRNLTIAVRTKTSAMNGSTSAVKQRGEELASSISKPISASSTTLPATPAKKGSYREIMDRAQAVKAVQSDFMLIKHKVIPKLTKKERLAQATEAVHNAKRSGGIANAGANGKSATGDRLRSKPGETTREKQKPLEAGATSKEKRKSVDLGYKGTMRPSTAGPEYKGTMRSSTTPQPSARKPEKVLPQLPSIHRFAGLASNFDRNYAYVNYSDEDDGEEDSATDFSDDMEAEGFNELEAEEEQSLRAAKQEDTRAMRQEAEHRKLKMERKRKLEQLVAAKRR